MTVSIFAFSLAILVAFTLDQNLSLFFKRPELEGIWLKARAVTNVGLSEHYFLIAILLYFFARWIRPNSLRLREWSRNLFFALLTSGIFVHILKFCFGRQRPHKSPDFNPFVFHPFTFHWDFHSFVSGHTQVLFTVATMLSLALPKGKWLFFILAAFFAFTRVIIHDHFLSDVIAGAVVGYTGTLTAICWTELWQSRRANVPKIS
ncbi:MAG TPA: phosphatase PAP2 family protein [Pseudobdellovibrionaceae bacterium]|jgi:membrane-associated phospholipid phosphatase